MTDKEHIGAAWRNHPVVMDGTVGDRPGLRTHTSACSAGGGHRWRIETPSEGKRLLRDLYRKCGGDPGDFKAFTDWLTARELLDRGFGGTR